MAFINAMVKAFALMHLLYLCWNIPGEFAEKDVPLPILALELIGLFSACRHVWREWR